MIEYWILKVEKIEIKGKNALVFMAAQLQQPWLVPTAYFLQFFWIGTCNTTTCISYYKDNK